MLVLIHLLNEEISGHRFPIADMITLQPYRPGKISLRNIYAIEPDEYSEGFVIVECRSQVAVILLDE